MIILQLEKPKRPSIVFCNQHLVVNIATVSPMKTFGPLVKSRDKTNNLIG